MKITLSKSALAKTTCFSAIAWLGAAGAHAQEAPVAPTSPAAEEADAIIVTGSRIARPELEAATPVNIISSTEISQTGRTNIAEVLRLQPAFSTGLSSGNTNFNSDGDTGVNLLDLRGLGPDRTLVLVNGRRFVSGVGSGSAVDVNMIPTDLIQNVQVVTGGASAVYGSDAIAGVVNFVLRDDFEGVEMRAQSGISSRGDAPRYRVSGTIGTNFADGRGNVWINGVYDRDEGLRSRNREFSRNDVFGRSSFAPQGAFGLNGTIFDVTDSDDALGSIYGNDYTFGENNALQQGFVQNLNGFNRNNFRLLRTPVERYIFNGAFHYDITDNITVYGEATYGKVKTRSQLEGYPSAGGDADVDGAGNIDVPGINIDNPFLPAPIRAAILARNGDADPTNDVGFVAFRRRLSDVFDRSGRDDREVYRFAGGLRGKLGSDWTWDASYVYGRTRNYTAQETIRADLLANSLNAITVNGQAVCADPAARAAGCRPLNLFGFESALSTPEAVNYVRGGGDLVSALTTTVTQQVAQASISGPLFRLWGGDIRAVVGAEYRHEKSISDWDENTNAGNTLGNLNSDTRGSYDVKDLFAEIVAPIIEDRPGLHYLGVNGAVRYDHYSTVGTVWSFKAGVEYAPIRDVRFRGMYSQASRAPTVSELFSAQSETFPGDLTLDPCNGVTATRQETFDAACRAIPGVAAAIAANGSFEYALAEIQGINGFNGGNPDLQEETAKTWTAGVVLTPSFAPRLSLSVDWYRIQVDDAINIQPRNETVRACLVDPASSTCGGFVQRLATGKVTRVDALLVNTGGFLTSGIDVALNYRLPVGPGEFDLSVNYTHLLEHKRKPFDGAAYINERGQLQDNLQERLGSGYKDRFVATAGYTVGPARFSWTTRYLGPIKDTLDPAGAPPPEVNNVGDAFYHDAQLRFSFGEDERQSFYLGVENIFDRDPPLLPSGLAASGQTGVESAQEYDTTGRFIYAGVQVKF